MIIKIFLSAAVIASAIFVLAAPPAAAEAGLVVPPACATAKATLCANVVPGGGRVMGCLQAKINYITVPRCVAALNADTQNAPIPAACTTEVAMYCGTVPQGGGRVLGCLMANGDLASPACRAAIGQ